jgi:hypothetical protein
MRRCADRFSAASGSWVFRRQRNSATQGSKLAKQPRYNVLCLGSSRPMTPRDLACFGFQLRLNLSRHITKILLLNSNSAKIIAYIRIGL